MGERNVFCTQCGALVVLGDKFCCKCGARIAAEPTIEKRVEEKPNTAMEPQTVPARKRGGMIALVAIAVAAVILVALLLLLPRQRTREDKVMQIVNSYCYDGYSDIVMSEKSLAEWLLETQNAVPGMVDMEYTVNEKIPDAVFAQGIETDCKDILCTQINVKMREDMAYTAYFLFGCDADAEKAKPKPLCLVMWTSGSSFSSFDVVLENEPETVVTVLYQWLSYLQNYFKTLENYGYGASWSYDGTFADYSPHEFLAELVAEQCGVTVEDAQVEHGGTTTDEAETEHSGVIEEEVTYPEPAKLIGESTCIGKLVYRPSEAGYYGLYLDEPLKLDCGHSYTDLWLFANYDGELNDYVDKTVQIRGELYEDEGRNFVYMYGDSPISLVEAKNETEDVLKAGSPITVSGTVGYSSEPSDIGEEYCFVKSEETISYMYEAIGGGMSQGQSDTLYVINEDVPRLIEYVGQQVTVSGEFASECHGIPYITNVAVQSSSGVAGTVMEERQTGYPSYDAKIYEYITATTMSDEEFETEYYWLDFEIINSYLVKLWRDYRDGSALAYTLYDINQDGTPELVFAQGRKMGDGTWGYFDIIDLYSLNGGNLVTSQWDDSLGYRYHLYVLSDGTLLGDGSSGASSGGCELYSIGFDGYAVPIEEYYFDDMSGPNPEHSGTYVSMDEYLEKRDAWMEKAVDLDRLTWTVFTGNE